MTAALTTETTLSLVLQGEEVWTLMHILEFYRSRGSTKKLDRLAGEILDEISPLDQKRCARGYGA